MLPDAHYAAPVITPASEVSLIYDNSRITGCQFSSAVSPGQFQKKIPSKPVSSFSPNFQPDSAGVIWWVFLRKKFWIFLCP
jgi:hypothetical protein